MRHAMAPVFEAPESIANWRGTTSLAKTDESEEAGMNTDYTDTQKMTVKKIVLRRH